MRNMRVTRKRGDWRYSSLRVEGGTQGPLWPSVSLWWPWYSTMPSSSHHRCGKKQTKDILSVVVTHTNSSSHTPNQLMWFTFLYLSFLSGCSPLGGPSGISFHLSFFSSVQPSPLQQPCPAKTPLFTSFPPHRKLKVSAVCFVSRLLLSSVTCFRSPFNSCWRSYPPLLSSRRGMQSVPAI